jgi:hypothetical protein
MTEEKKSPLRLSRKIGDHILLILLSPFIMLISGSYAWMFLRKPFDGVKGLLINAIAFELFFSVFCVSSLALVWGLFAPRWLETTLHRAARKAGMLMAIPALGLLVAVVYILLHPPS